jgi:hypothetical protein
MFPGFTRIVEERIKKAQKDGLFEDLTGFGRPLVFQDDRHIPEELRLAYKILRNADCLPPEIELQRDIRRTEDLMAQMPDTAAKYRLLRKLNFMIMKLNSIRQTSITLEEPQRYTQKLVERFSAGPAGGTGSKKISPKTPLSDVD